jgi:hypothetical protein
MPEKDKNKKLQGIKRRGQSMVPRNFKNLQLIPEGLNTI